MPTNNYGASLERPNNRYDVFAGDGDDIIYGGYGFANAYHYGGRGDDTIYLPKLFRTLIFEGGLGDDLAIAGAEDEAIFPLMPEPPATAQRRNLTVNMKGGEGNDRLEGVHKARDNKIYGGDDNDKIIAGNDNVTLEVYGEDHDDIIYGGDRTSTSEMLFGDFMLGGVGTPEKGGNDKIYGGNDIPGT